MQNFHGLSGAKSHVFDPGATPRFFFWQAQQEESGCGNLISATSAFSPAASSPSGIITSSMFMILTVNSST